MPTQPTFNNASLQKQKTDGLLLLIDFKKAFDSIDHGYIYDTLRSINFGDDIIEWVKLFLTDIIAHILLRGHLTLKILLEKVDPKEI